MLFFRGPEDASAWVEQHPGLAVLSVGEAYSLTRDILIDPLLNLISRSK